MHPSNILSVHLSIHASIFCTAYSTQCQRGPGAYPMGMGAQDRVVHVSKTKIVNCLHINGIHSFAYENLLYPSPWYRAFISKCEAGILPRQDAGPLQGTICTHMYTPGVMFVGNEWKLEKLEETQTGFKLINATHNITQDPENSRYLCYMLHHNATKFRTKMS